MKKSRFMIFMSAYKWSANLVRFARNLPKSILFWTYSYKDKQEDRQLHAFLLFFHEGYEMR